MPDRFDIVVAGAGHNSLVAAAYLAKAGYRCLVLEGRSVLGGNVVTEELTLPGFRHDSCGTAHVILQDSPMMRNDELGLADYGLEYIHPEIVCHAPFLDGSYLTQYHDIERTIEQFAKFSKKDAAAYRRMIDEYDAIKPLFDAASYTPIGFGKPINDRLNEHPDGRKWLRRQAQSAWEIIRDNFEDDHCRCFMLWMAFQTVTPPEWPMTGRQRLFAGVGPAALELVHPEGRLRRAHRNPGAADRGSRRRRADQQDGAAPDRRERQMRRRRMRRRLVLSRRQGGALDHPHQAPDRHGAARSSGPMILSKASRPGRAGRRCSSRTTPPASR